MKTSKLYRKFDKSAGIQRERLAALTREAKASKASMIKAQVEKVDIENRLARRDQAAMVLAYLARIAQTGETFELSGRYGVDSAGYTFRLRSGAREGFVTVADYYLSRRDERSFDMAIEGMIRAVHCMREHDSNPWGSR